MDSRPVIVLWDWVRLARQATDRRVGKVVAVRMLEAPMLFTVEWDDGTSGVYLLSELETW